MAEVAVAELALDGDQWYALVGHLDRMRMSQPMWREPSTHPGGRRGEAQVGARGGG
jgi:hypothetical protein